MIQQCPGKENKSHLGVSSIVPKVLQVLIYLVLHLVINMTIWVVKISREGFRIRWIFGSKSTCSNEIVYFVNRPSDEFSK